ncbi:cadherin-related family member 2-like isoform X2 [Pristis pectinata]|uniref:cadherin-related family member 2-like isoform X2 n=1 Tax=Pristis pectinata TaxID=685728 RepID=UPI00223C8D43|nr:cadherin-related family member 2-like isoform X2 [Pristis pectinata]
MLIFYFLIKFLNQRCSCLKTVSEMVAEQRKILQCFSAICFILISQKSVLIWSQNLAPTFMANMTVVRVTEDAPKGTSVFRIAAEDKDGDPLLYGLEGELASVYFTVNSTSGDVTIKEAIDREIYANSNDHFGITITVDDGLNALVKKTLHIFIEDVNDNAPAFKGLPYQADVAENEEVGMEIFKVFASDSDRGNNGSVTYEILEFIPSDNVELFEISKNGSVFLKGQLEFARASIYQVLVKAVDQGKPEAKYSTTRLIINVIDIPNKPPEYLSSVYHVRIPENLPVNTVIITVTAIDGDRGINNPITYSINGTSTFKVDNVTGKVTTASMLDRENMEELITIDITAFELVNGIKDLSATATTTITILILDVNDNKPIFYSMHGTSTDTFRAIVPEETANGMPILHIFAQDLDQGNNGTFGAFLQGPDSTAFNLNRNIVYNEGMLTIQVANSEALDFERNDFLQFQIFAIELETKERFSSFANIRIVITDRNDNRPVFNQDYFMLEVPEDSTNGYNVTCITATDADSAHFGEITYQLFGSDSVLQTFDVDPVFGVFFIKNKTLLDRETRPQFFVTLQARDGGGLTTNAQIRISISDANDQVPVFQGNSYSGFIKENEVKNIVQVQAFDRDQANSPNSEITYTIIDGDLVKYFIINGSNGVISVVKPLDRESMDVSLNGIINLIVQAKDGGNPALSSTVQVAITVEDVNDNGPVFNQSTYFVAVPEDQQDRCVFEVRALDSDVTDSNRLMTYRIEDGARGQFIISTGRGELQQSACIHVTPETRLDYDGGPRKYRLTVAAIDFGFDPNTGYTTIQVDILDANDEAPILIGSSLSNVFANENGIINTTIVTIQAFDPDTDAELHFFIRGTECLDEKGRKMNSSLCKNWFQLTERSGSLVYSGPVDRESVQAVLLRVQVVDYNTVHSSNMSEEGHVKIIIADENDNAPIFSGTENRKVVVLEFVTEGLEVAVLEATDRDAGKNGAITFHIGEVNFTVPGASPVNKTTTESFYVQTSLNSKYMWEGSLRIKNHLELSLKGCWKIKIVAVDGGKPSNTVHHLLEVYVVNGSSKLQLVFDKLPGTVLLMEKQILSILEAAVPGTNVVVSKVLPAIKTSNLKRTIMDIYFIDDKGIVVNPDVIRGEIEKNVSALTSLIDLGLRAVGSLSSHLKSDNKANLHRVISILAVANITSVALAVLLPVYIRQRYQRKLKAASSISVAQLTSVKRNPMVFDVPGTNMYTTEGSNPIWNKTQFIEVTSCFNEDTCSDQQSLNSLDDNPIADEKDYFNIREPNTYKYQEKRGNVFFISAQKSDSENSHEATAHNFLSIALASHEERKCVGKPKSGKMINLLNNRRLNGTDL